MMLFKREPEHISTSVDEISKPQLNVPVRAAVLQCIELHSPVVIHNNNFTVDERIRGELIAAIALNWQYRGPTGSYRKSGYSNAVAAL
jgi:hypothetical protein